MWRCGYPGSPFALARNFRLPNSLKIKENMRHYDAIIIGAGQGGDPLARAFAQAGKRTALIERKYVGGTCVNYGCTPTKTLYNSARVAYLARRAHEFGVTTGDVEVHLAKAQERVQKVVEDFRNGTEKRLKEIKNLDLIYGAAKFIDNKTIQVNDDQLTADKIIINVGTRAFIPDVPGLQDVPYMDNKCILELKELPKHLIVLGGGYIGLEFAQMFRRLGSQVTVIERAQRLIEREDEDVCETATQFLKEDGIRIITGADIRQISAPQPLPRLGETPLSNIAIELTTGEKIEGSHLLVAIGRTPNTDDLALDKAGVETDERGYIKANEKLETSTNDIYVIGDVKGGPAFTHISYDDFRILKCNLLENGNKTTKDRLVPYVMFLDPQLGRVGLDETHAEKQNIKVRVAKIEASNIARPIEMSETRGFIKALVGDQDQIVGVTTFCVEGGELLASLQIAMMAKLPYTALRDGIFAHPTLAESMNNLFMNLK